MGRKRCTTEQTRERCVANTTPTGLSAAATMNSLAIRGCQHNDASREAAEWPVERFWITLNCVGGMGHGRTRLGRWRGWCCVS